MFIRKGTITPISDYLYGKPVQFPDFYERIEKIQKAGLINMIIIDGRSQTGKSTFGRKLCEYFDKDYIRIFTVSQLLDLLFDLSKKHQIGHYGNYKWLLFDEIEIESSRAEWWSERNKVLTAIISSYGFLRINIVMTLPNIKGLSDILLTNISMRISIIAEFDDKTQIVKRLAFIKKPVWVEKKNKYIWLTIQRHQIPIIEKDMDYEKEKFENFFGVQLPKWQQQILKEENTEIKRFLTPTSIMKLLKENKIDRDFAIRELERSGFDYGRADLFIESHLESEIPP